MTEPREPSLDDIPASVMLRAQNDMDFATRLLHRDTREEALREPALQLTDDQRSDLSARLDDIANMSLQDAMGKIRDAGVVCLG